MKTSAVSCAGECAVCAPRHVTAVEKEARPEPVLADDDDRDARLVKRLTAASEAAVAIVVERISQLWELVDVTKETFKETLKQASGHGTHVLAASGNLQSNRELVFVQGLRTPKQSRQAADELLQFRSNLLSAVEANGRVLAATKKELAPYHTKVYDALRETGTTVRAAVETLRREGKALKVAQKTGQISETTAETLERRFRELLGSVSESGQQLGSIAAEVTKCREAYKHAMDANKAALKKAMDNLKRDHEVLSDWSFDRVSSNRIHDRNFVLSVIEANGESLERVPEEFKNDPEIVMAAVQSSGGWALQFAAEPMRRNRDIVLTAVRRSGWALEHAAEEMRADRAIVAAAVEATGEALEFASSALKSDRDLVHLAIRRSGGWALQVASAELRADRTLVLAAVSQNGLVLQHADTALTRDRRVVSAAVSKNGMALEHASADLRTDCEVVGAAVRSNPMALQYALGEAWHNLPIALEAVANDGFALEFVPASLQANFDVVFAAVQDAGTVVLDHADARIRWNEQILAAARKTDREKEVQMGDMSEGISRKVSSFSARSTTTHDADIEADNFLSV